MNTKRERSGRSIFTIQLISYLLVILLISATFGIFFFSTAKRHLEDEVGGKLQDIAKIASANVPYERLELIKTGDDETRMVLRLKEKFNEIQEATGVKDVFLFLPDRTSLLDLHPQIPIGTRYVLSHFDDAFMNHLARGESVHTGSYRTPAGNLFISAYAPVRNPGGALFAVVGVNAGTREIEVIERMRVRIYLIAGFGVVLAFILALLLTRRLTNPIRGMAAAAERIGSGDYSARIVIPSTAELGVLASSINTMAEQIQERDLKLKEMAASVAHEIRNPLNSIKLLISLLDEELREQHFQAHQATVETLHYEIGKLNRFLSEFLTFSRPLVLTRSAADPAELAAGVVEMAAADAREHQVRVSLHPETGLPVILIDRPRVEQSLLNLLLNAIQASGRNGRVELKIMKSKKDQGVDFRVEDSGPGIPPEIRGKLFQPFFTTKENGTGLGLSNAEKIVAGHGGGITAENIPGRGACFSMHFPPGQEDEHG